MFTKYIVPVKFTAAVVDAIQKGKRQCPFCNFKSNFLWKAIEPIFATVTGTVAKKLKAIKLIAPTVNVVPNVIDWILLTPTSPCANWNGTNVPITAVAGYEDIVAVFPATPSLLV